MRSAVLFLVFNRPDVTAQVFGAIRQAKPPRLYVAADGPRADRAGEAQQCGEVRRIVSAVDWPCKVETLFREENLGCKLGVAGAISWFFEHEEEGIILEDDCLPAPTFFPYCDELLERYRDDVRVLTVLGSNYLLPSEVPGTSYYFSNYADVWGWATWRRAWKNYDIEMRDWPALRGNPDIIRPAHGDRAVVRHWTNNFDLMSSGSVNTIWGIQWLFACWRIGGVHAMPSRNQIANLGFGPNSTNTGHDIPRDLANPVVALEFPLKHPPKVEASVETDRIFSRRRCGISRVANFKRMVRGTPIVGGLLAGAKRAAKAAISGTA